MIEVFKKTPILKVISFFLILFILISFATVALLYRDRKTDNSSYQIINFYKEKKNDMDFVFIGSSNCFSFYSPLFAYNAYGIKTTNFSSSGMGMIAFKNAIEEVNKTQPDAHIVITVTPMDEMSYSALHYLADYMPMSMNKLNLLKRYFSRGDESLLNSAEYFFPLMRFHERWSEIGFDDLILDNGTKGATAHEYYLTYVTDLSDEYLTSDKENEIRDSWSELMEGLLNYCDENEKDVSFLFPPRLYEETEYSELNSLIKYIESRGYDVLDLRNKCDEIGLNIKYDFYDIVHTNVHGSLKYTDYVISTLMKKHGIKVSEKDADDYNKAFDKYLKLINPYILNVELDPKDRDYKLDRPELSSAIKTNGQVEIKWAKVENADGYVIYRKVNDEWKTIGEATEDKFIDNDPTEGSLYTVISYRMEGDKRLYGNYDYKGIEVN